ncbi:uncharacterized protein [Drosophila takahashii]|uniref:uncharacterized protein n=1 Tax=Drosophila takahashii TaxID=29030 RepID=UPI001CF92215|nr:uncharacterized protein YBL113C [Drosophila takahashii]
MAALKLIIIFLMASAGFLRVSEAQTFTAEDRSSIQKFMDSLLNFLELEISNATTTTAPSNDTSLETTSLAPGNSTEVTTEVSQSSTNSTSSVSDSSTSASTSTSTSTSNSTTANTNTTLSTTTAKPTTIRTRICFKRFCYKFSNDKGYIV